MTETSSAQPSLSTMRLAELQSLAGSMGLKGISRMRKSELVSAIRQALTRNYFHRDPAASARRLASLRGRPFDAAALEPAYRAAQEKLQAHAAQLL